MSMLPLFDACHGLLWPAWLIMISQPPASRRVFPVPSGPEAGMKPACAGCIAPYLFRHQAGSTARPRRSLLGRIHARSVYDDGP